MPYDEFGNWIAYPDYTDPNLGKDPSGQPYNPDGSVGARPGTSPSTGYQGGGAGVAPVDPSTPTAPTPTPNDPTQPTPTPTPQQSTVGPFTGTFTAPNARPLPAFPTYTPPPAFAFKAPTPEDAKNDPGYQFRVQQGNQGLQAWAAAKGTLNDTGTATALDELNQNEATQEYANVWNRDWQQQTGQYQTNYQTQYVDPYQFGVQGYSAQAPNVLHENDMDYQHAWDAFINDEDLWKFNATLSKPAGA